MKKGARENELVYDAGEQSGLCDAQADTSADELRISVKVLSETQDASGAGRDTDFLTRPKSVLRLS